MLNRGWVAVLVVCTLGAGRVWAQETSDVQIETIHVAGPVYMLVGSGGNLGVSAGPDGIFLIDDQFAPLSEKIQQALDTLSSSPLRFVLNTHYHPDHTGGNEILGKRAPIIAHANVRTRLSTGGVSRLFGTERKPVGPGFLPILTYKDGVSIHVNDEDIEVRHLPHAHTDGDSIVIFTGSHVAHLGDLMFSGRFPYVDLDGGGSVQGLVGHIERLLAELPRDIQIIPGHGPLSGYEDLQQYHDMLVETTRLVRQRVEAGQTEDEAVVVGLPERWSDWGRGFINEANWIRIIYRAYSQEVGVGHAGETMSIPRPI